MALAGLTLIGLFLNSKSKIMLRLALLALVIPILLVMVQTGSRAGVGAFVIGCALYSLPFLQQKRRLAGIILAILGVAALGYTVAQNPDFVERWQLASEGNWASREEITPAAIEMILERPVLGWQPVEFVYELGKRLGSPSGRKDSHNLFLWLFAEVGSAGAIPFLVGLGLCARAAWRARTGHLGLLPGSLLTAILAANMTHSYIVEKAHWLIFALAVASAASLSNRRRSHVRVSSSGLRLKARAHRLVRQS